MATSFNVTCPECDKPAKTSDEMVGKKIRCKGCDHVFVVKAPKGQSGSKAEAIKSAAAKSPAGKGPSNSVAKPKPDDKKPPAKPAADDEDDDKPYGVTDQDLSNRCPECANKMESEDAVVCLHCGYNTVTRTRARTKKVLEASGEQVFLWLLPGILSVLGFLLLLGFDILYTVKIEAWTYKGDFEFLAHQAIIFWLWILSVFGLFFMVRFAIIRLCINNKPPEVEKNL